MTYEYHEVANIFPLLEGDEYESFKQDIKQNGLHEPIWLYQNKIIDGRNRYRACLDTDIEPRYREWNGHGSLVSFVVSLNLHRRHLNSSQKAMMALDVLPLLEEEAKERQGTRTDIQQQIAESDRGQARDKAAQLLQTNRQYVSDAKAVQEKAPELAEKVRRGELTIPEAKKEIKKQANEDTRQRIAALGSTTEISVLSEIVCSDFRAYFETVPDDSVDLIFTDPPYDKESISLYGDLAFHAARVLRPGGSLLVYVGHYAIPAVSRLMGDHLRYWWMLALSHQSGNHRRLEGVKVYVHWKPILWYVKGTYTGKRAMADMFETSTPNKELHDWAQDISAASYYIDYLTEPNDLVVDPMCGSGTICLAAVKSGRRTIGVEIDQERANVARYTLGK